ncbi:MAG TPA: CPBP family intramembrane glutamic endopeptidase [Candidatus Baltobacteraceae bacterium]|nr:CPBP family intramembrane glutamic endopeptidase [Candidatus Baltobacteraceae bacterium]
MQALVRGIVRAFVGSDRKLRPIWRAVLFFVLGNFALPMLLATPVSAVAKALHVGDELSAGSIAFYEGLLLAIALLLTWLFGMYEGKRVDDYGLPVRAAFGRRFWEGFAIGILNAGLVAAGMIALGGMTIHGFALHGPSLLWAGLGWLGANVAVGLGEEMWYRGYLLQSLWKSLGFWPASIVIALLFASDHYFFKQGENVWDVITLVSLSLWVCYSVLRTGTLWLAVGYHVAFDYMQLFVIGTKNGNLVPVNHLLDVTFSGPAWITGGVLGTEASFLMYPIIALMFVYVWRNGRPSSFDCSLRERSG